MIFGLFTAYYILLKVVITFIRRVLVVLNFVLGDGLSAQLYISPS